MDNTKNITGKIYIFSYCCLLFTSIFYFLSEFHALNGMPEPLIVSNGYYLGLGIFVILQLFLLMKNLFMEGNIYRECLFLFVIFSIIFSLIFHLKSSSQGIVLMIILIVNSNLVDLKKILKIDLLLKVCCFALILSMFFLKLFPSEYSEDILKHGSIIRMTLGFNHPNTLAGFYLSILISLLLYIDSRMDINCLSWMRKILLFSFISISGIYVEFMLADSRSSEIAIAIMILFLFFYMNYKIKVPSPFIGLIFMLIVCAIAVGLSIKYNYGSSIMNQLNILSSNRLFLQHSALQEYGIKILGNPEFMQGNPYWIDNQYVFNLLNVGIIGFIFLLWLFYELFKISFERSDFVLFIITIAIAVKSMFESTTFEIYMFMLFIYAFKIEQEKKNFNSI